MSGTKENQNVTQVRRVKSTPSVSLSRLNDFLDVPSTDRTSFTSGVVESPLQIKKQFEKATPTNIRTLPLNELQTQLKKAIAKVAPQLKVTDSIKVNQIHSEIQNIMTATSTDEAFKVFENVTKLCVDDHAKVFKSTVATTVELVMIEVGFSTITVKHIGCTPVVIAKNQLGQTIRTEISDNEKGEISLVRIQSGIEEAECDSLNQRINEAFIKKGLIYKTFVKVEKTRQKSNQEISYDCNEDQNSFTNNVSINQIKN